MCGRYTLKKEWNQGVLLITPGTKAPIRVLSSDGNGTALLHATYGIVPTWGINPRIYNARCETLATRTMFRDLLKTGRCVVIATSFSEGGAKFVPEEKIYRMAGLTNGRDFVVITTPASSMVQVHHHRMPALLSEEAARAWLRGPDTSILIPFEGINQYREATGGLL